MRKVLVLLLKDLYYNQNMYIGVLAAVTLLIIASILGLDGSNAGSTMNYLVYTCCASIVITPYSYNLEDDLSTRKFLLSLPITLKQIIIAKFLLTITASGLISSIGLFLFECFGEGVLYRCALIPISLSLAMTSGFIFLFYNWDANIARVFSVVPIVIFAIFAKELEDNREFSGESLSINSLVFLLVGIFVIALVSGIITIKLAHK